MLLFIAGVITGGFIGFFICCVVAVLATRGD